MGNTWNTVETAKSPTGIAEIKVSSTGDRVRVTFEDGSIDKKFNREDLPDVPKHLKSGKYFVALSNDKSEVTRIGPANTKAPLTVRCVDFVRPEEGADPEPKEYENKAKHYSYMAFTVLLEVQEGMFKGSQVPMFMHYKFVDDGTGMVGFKGNRDKSPRLRDLQDFLEYTGVTEEPMEWPEDDNVLPEILSRVKRQKRDFQVIIKNGYVETMLSGDDYEEDDYEEDMDDVEEEIVEEKPRARKPAKQNLKEPGYEEDELDVDEEFPAKKSAKKVRMSAANEDEEDDL